MCASHTQPFVGMAAVICENEFLVRCYQAGGALEEAPSWMDTFLKCKDQVIVVNTMFRALESVVLAKKKLETRRELGSAYIGTLDQVFNGWKREG